MIQCQNCGQGNARASNFCRFCGTKFVSPPVSNNTDFEQAPPRPYSWKTDEFQITDAPGQKQRAFNQAQPLAGQAPITYQPPRPPQPLVYQKPQPQNLAYNVFCPRCASQIVRYERKVSTAGWIVFAALMVTFFPLFWIGLLIKENVRVCQVCNYKIG